MTTNFNRDILKNSRVDFLAAFFFGFLVGVFFRSFVDLGLSFSFFTVLLGISFLVYWLFVRANPNKFWILFFSIFVLSFSGGMFRYDFFDWNQRSRSPENFVGQNLKFQGVIFDEPNEKDKSVELPINLEKIFMADGKEIPASDKVLVLSKPYPKFKYGDRIAGEGKIEKPKNIPDANGKIFDYASYLEKDGINFVSNFPKLALVSSGNGNFVKENLFKLKKAFSQKISASISEPQASLLGGILLGAKQSLGKKLLDDFRKAGVIHIVVLSGYNITIVAEGIKWFFSFLPRFFGIYLGAAGIILFAIMTGAGATVVRSSIMALIVLLGRATGRAYEIKRALFVAGFLMVLQNPKILVFDSSFQLSFMAALGLLYVAPLLEKRFLFIPGKWGIREIFVSTLATQIFVLPLLVYKMGEISSVSIFANLLILSFIPTTMLFGFVTALSGFLNYFLALPFAFATYVLLSYELKVVEIFSSLPLASFSISYFPAFFLFLIYALYAAIIFWSNKKAASLTR